jgi:hypothetical protein
MILFINFIFLIGYPIWLRICWLAYNFYTGMEQAT